MKNQEADKKPEGEEVVENTLQPDHELPETDHSPEAELEEALAEQKDKYLRLFAEFENFRKRTARERLELIETASQDLMTRLLPVLDDFDRAMKSLDAVKEEYASAVNGVELIKNKLFDTLKAKGLSPMESTVGKPFDVETMEAITNIPAPDESLKGKVVDEIERGYQLGSRIIRYAKVVVGE